MLRNNKIDAFVVYFETNNDKDGNKQRLAQVCFLDGKIRYYNNQHDSFHHMVSGSHSVYLIKESPYKVIIKKSDYYYLTQQSNYYSSHNDCDIYSMFETDLHLYSGV